MTKLACSVCTRDKTVNPKKTICAKHYVLLERMATSVRAEIHKQSSWTGARFKVAA